MEWFNFHNVEFIVFFVILVTALLLLTFFILTFFYQESSEKNYFEQIKVESNTTRIYIIDAKKNLVTYFNRSDIKHKKTMDLASFYLRFHEDDKEKVKNWIFQICVDHSKVQTYLEADIVLRHSKRSLFSLLKLVDYHPEKGLIHLESKMLKYITPHSEMKRKKKITGLPVGQVTRGAMASIISKYKSPKGYTFSVRFLNVSQRAFDNDEEERFMILTLKNSVYPFALDKVRLRQLVDVNNREMLLVDLRLDTKEEAFRLASSMAQEITRSISINSFQTFIKFTIGVVENGQFFQDFDAIVRHAQEASLVADQKNEQIYFYEKTAIPAFANDRYKEQIDSLIKDNKLRYLFRPIVDVKAKKIPGYFTYVKSYGAAFSGYNEMMKYANQCSRSRELFSVVAKNVINRFADQNLDKDCRLFYPVSVFDFKNIETIIPQISGKSRIRLVLVFEEQEFNQNSSNTKALNEYLVKLHLLGYELALTMIDKNLLLDPAIYNNFDYFVAGTSMTNELKKSGLSRLSIRTLIESLLKYEKPIIASALEGWQEVELIIKSGVYLVSSDVIAQSNEMVLPVEKKKLDKLASIDKYA